MVLQVNRNHNFPKNDETPIIGKPTNIWSTFREIKKKTVRICQQIVLNASPQTNITQKIEDDSGFVENHMEKNIVVDQSKEKTKNEQIENDLVVPSLMVDDGSESPNDSIVLNLQKIVFVKYFDTIFKPLRMFYIILLWLARALLIMTMIIKLAFKMMFQEIVLKCF